MTHPTSSTLAATSTNDGHRQGSAGLAAAGAGSVLALALATWWLVAPGRSPLTDPSLVIIAGWLPAAAVSAVVIASGLLGTVAAALALARPERRAAVPLVLVAVLDVAVFGLALQGIRSISLAGYLVALALPIGLLLLLIQSVRRYRRLRWVAIFAALAAAVWGAAAQTLAPAHLLDLYRNLATGFANAGIGTAVAVLFTGTAAAWAIVVIGAVRGSEMADRATAAITRQRVPITIIAACGPLPYALVRMTWLTPWPLFSPAGEELTPEMRLWGLSLGGAALLGAVLTIGLIRPWGERFPRWMPWLAGRPVPVAAAALPGGVIAAILCFSAIPMLAQLTFSAGGSGVGVVSSADRALTALIFPFWWWGPMLALAVGGYVGHRRMTATITG